MAISEERLIRRKFPYTFPVHSLAYCMERFGLTDLSQIDVLVSDFIRRKQWFRSGPAYNTSDFDYLKIKFDFDPAKIVQISHHMAHAAAAYYASGYESSAILIVDGNGSDLETTSFLVGEGTKISYVDTYRGRGIGAVYSAVTNWILGLGTGGEGKTMGLAPYGESHDKVLEINGVLDGIRNDFSSFMRRMPYSDILNQIDLAHRINPLHKDYPRASGKEQVQEPYFARVAFDVQAETERVMIHLGKELFARTKQPNVCVAGGVGLNSVANKLMFDASGFENIFAFPACSDAGIPFGLALWGYYNAEQFKHLPKRRISFGNAYTGRDYPQGEIDDVLDRNAVPSTRTTPDEVARLLSEGKIVGWFQGGSEYGPRSLGHRSILADSRRAEMRDIVNERVKHRETYRPFAPAVLLEDCAEYFDIDGDSPFMLLVADTKRPDLVPAVTHVDNTARVQTVTAHNNGVFYDLVAAFKRLTGVPVLMNTSFNDAGEPIVETPEDALICFSRTEMDYLVLGDRLIAAGDAVRAIGKTLFDQRAALIVRREAEITARFFPGGDKTERDAYVEAENRQAVWHTLYRAKYELERKVMEWAKERKRVLVVGTLDHTDALLRHIGGLATLTLTGIVAFAETEYPTGDAPALERLTRLDGAAIKAGDYDAILVSSHEFHYEILDLLDNAGLTDRAFSPYDNSSRSLIEAFQCLPSFKI
ncbi:MAG: carbamoyltransferase C-terminal domain-containing protein [Phaeospirillum sp.]|nr:carbamoyltransferase C-terminal domain-containing protein [Phaeospirillum sp.]